MAADNTLIFEGTRWQTARAVPAGSTLFEITATGRGRKWATDTPLGFWRTFAEIPLNDGDAVAGFVQRYGDPWGELDARKPVHTARWGDLASALAAVADAWAVDPRRPNGPWSLSARSEDATSAPFRHFATIYGRRSVGIFASNSGRSLAAPSWCQ